MGKFFEVAGVIKAMSIQGTPPPYPCKALYKLSSRLWVKYYTSGNSYGERKTVQQGTGLPEQVNCIALKKNCLTQLS